MIIRIRSNLYGNIVGSDPLLGVDKDFKKVKIAVDITCNNEKLNFFFHPDHNPTYPCCQRSTSEASLEIAGTIEQEVKC